MKRQKGINARAWFYSTSFHSNLNFQPSEELKQTVAALKQELDKLTSEKSEQLMAKSDLLSLNQ